MNNLFDHSRRFQSWHRELNGAHMQAGEPVGNVNVGGGGTKSFKMHEKKKQAAMQSSRLSPYIVCLFTLFPFQFLLVCEYIAGPTFKIPTFSTGSGTFSGCKCLSWLLCKDEPKPSPKAPQKWMKTAIKPVHRSTQPISDIFNLLLFWRQNSELRTFFSPFLLATYYFSVIFFFKLILNIFILSEAVFVLSL